MTPAEVVEAQRRAREWLDSDRSRWRVARTNLLRRLLLRPPPLLRESRRLTALLNEGDKPFIELTSAPSIVFPGKADFRRIVWERER